MNCLDTSLLAELSDVLGDDLYSITRFFIAGLDEQIDNVVAHHRSGDMAQLAGYAHALKGSAANMGATKLAAAASLIEKSALACDADATNTPVAELPSLAAEVTQALRASGYAPPADTC